MSAHAKFSPSGSSIWLACAASPTLSEGIEDRGSIHAQRGTMAHQVLEECLKDALDGKGHVFEPKCWVGRKFDGDAEIWVETGGNLEFNTEDADAVQVALDYCLGEIEPGDMCATEERLVYNAEYWGTCDFNRFRPSTQELLVVDYKHGSGVPVDALDNPQGVSYGLMRLKSLGNIGARSVRFVIIQPRAIHEEGSIIREFVVDAVDMFDWEDRLVAGMSKANEAKAMFSKWTDGVPWWQIYTKSGKHCRWCAASPTCPRLKDDARVALENDFEPIAIASKAGAEYGYDMASLVDALGLVARVKAWAKTTDEFAYAEAERGVRIPGYKLVQKRPTAHWRDVAELQGVLDTLGVPESESHDPAEMKSPAQIRSVLAESMPGKTKKARDASAKSLLDMHTDYISSGHTLVPDDDPRPAIRTAAEDDFGPVV